jgi:hypothetical protein
MVSEHRVGGAPKAVVVLSCEPIPSGFLILPPLEKRFMGSVGDVRGRCDVTACVMLRYCFIALAMTLCTTSPTTPLPHDLPYNHCTASLSRTVAYSIYRHISCTWARVCSANRECEANELVTVGAYEAKLNASVMENLGTRELGMVGLPNT